MREIKFRAWDKKDKKMIPWEGMYGLERAEGGVAVHLAIADQCYLMPDDIVLMEYTGVKDRRGQEIYAGDIVETTRGRGQVFNRLGCWFVEHQKELGYIQEDITVVGNIYENPSLLKEE